MKKLVSLSIFIILLIGLFPNISQAALPLDVQALKKKYNLKSISKVPCRALAQKYKTTSEVDRAIKKINSSLKFKAARAFAVPKAFPATVTKIAPALAPRKYSQKYSTKTDLVSLNMFVTYTTTTDSKGNRAFGDVLNVQTYILGPTVCVKWTQLDYEYLNFGNFLRVDAYALVEVSFEYKGFPFTYTIETILPVVFKNP